MLRVRILAMLGLALVASACQRSGPEVVVYTSEDQVFSEPVLKDLEKTSGIKVRAVYDTEETRAPGSRSGSSRNVSTRRPTCSGPMSHCGP